MLRLLIAVAMAGAACSEAPADFGPFSIRFTLDDRPGSMCEATSCDEYGMRCGAVVSIRIRDVEDNNRVVDEACQDVPPSETLCDLGKLGQPTFFNIPPHRLRVEVAAWRREVLEADPDLAGNCPGEGLFDLRGVPVSGFQPQPAFAGAAYFDAGEDNDEAVVPLTCSDARQIDLDECGAQTEIRARIVDIESGLDIDLEQAQSLNVGAAVPRAELQPSGEVVHVIEGPDTVSLAQIPGPVPIFSAEVDELPGDFMCAVVLDLAPQSTASTTCRQVSGDEAPVELTNVLVGKTTLDQILTALGQPVFPAGGLIIGRVVDHTGVPLDQVVVDPQAGSVEYLSADRTMLVSGQTTDSGFFVAQNVPYDTLWTAQHLDGRMATSEIRAGLIRGVITSILIRMEPPPL